MKKQGLILAAGLGSRLGEENTPKPLIEIHGKALIIRTMENLERGGCNEIVVVLGYAADAVKGYIGDHYSGKANIVFVINDQYRLSNGLSVLAAKQVLTESFVLSMADHLFSHEIARLVKNTPLPASGAALFVDYKIEEVFDLDDATKVVAINDDIISIGKSLQTYNCIDTGLFLCSTDLLDALQNVYDQCGDASLSEGITELSKQNTMKTIDIGSAKWQDVDDQAMLKQALEFASDSLTSLRSGQEETAEPPAVRAAAFH